MLTAVVQQPAVGLKPDEIQSRGFKFNHYSFIGTTWKLNWHSLIQPNLANKLQ